MSDERHSEKEIQNRRMGIDGITQKNSSKGYVLKEHGNPIRYRVPALDNIEESSLLKRRLHESVANKSLITNASTDVSNVSVDTNIPSRSSQQTRRVSAKRFTFRRKGFRSMLGV